MRAGLVLVSLLLLGAPAQAGTVCGGALPRGPVGLPDTILVKGACGTLALRRDGTIAPVQPRPWAPPWARRALARADRGTYIAHTRGHLVLLRAARVLWRSQLAHGSDDVVVHGEAIAFTAYVRPHPDLWVARLGAVERLVGRGEDLAGWARAGGFFTQRGSELRLRAPDGRLLRHLALIRTSVYDAGTQTLIAVTSSGLLIRTDGRQTATLARVGSLGAGAHPWVELVPGGLLALTSGNRLVVLRRDGSRFASAYLGRQPGSALGATIVSSLVSLPAERGVLFAVNQRRRTSNDQGTDRVLLLERGARVPRLLYKRAAGPASCGYGVNLSLRGDTVLYSTSGGHTLVALDVLGRRPALDLWPILRRTPGFRHHGWLRRAAWASAWNR